MQHTDDIASPMVLVPDNIGNLQDIIDILSVANIVVDGQRPDFYKVAHLFRCGIPDGQGGIS